MNLRKLIDSIRVVYAEARAQSLRRHVAEIEVERETMIGQHASPSTIGLFDSAIANYSGLAASLEDRARRIRERLTP